jgi:A/G-specific adenine glycosylase
MSDPRRDQAVVRQLSRWFLRDARPLPWRKRRSGYSGLVSEAMLQQTQVSRVLGPYERFMARFPRVAELAAADEQEVLAMWQGLGYYRRARQLHAAAKMIVSRFGGRVPRSAAKLRELPGVGRYTAGAIASIAFGELEPIVDGNVHRVLARLDAHVHQSHAHDARAPQGMDVAAAWERAAQLVARAPSPGAFNEALMELGATICTPAPAAPRCDRCPLARHGRARAAGVEQAVPAPKAPPPRTVVHHHAVIVRRSGSILLEQRSATGLWASMWQTPTIEADRAIGDLADIERLLPLRVSDLARLGAFEHQTSHRRIVFHIHEARTRVRRGVWRHPAQTADLPMSNAHRRIIALADSAATARR